MKMNFHKLFPMAMFGLFGIVGCAKIFETSGTSTNKFTSPNNPSKPNPIVSGDKPSCVITSSQQGWHNSSVFDLEFSCEPPKSYPSDDIARIECRDSQLMSWGDCLSSTNHSYTNLQDGVVVLEIKATTKKDRVSPIRKFTLKVDSNPPEVESLTFDSFIGNLPRFSVFTSDAANGSGVDKLYCQLIGPSVSDSWWNCAGGSAQNFTIDKTLVNNESYVLNVKAKDKAANESPVIQTSFVVQHSAPSELCSITPVSSPTRFTSQSMNFSCYSAHRISLIECRLDGNIWQSCQSPKAYSNLSEGPHQFEVRFKNTEGLYSAPQQASWTIDLTPPTVQITQADIDGVSAFFGFNATDNDLVARTECSIHKNNQSPTYRSCSNTYSAEGLELGKNYIFSVKATDRAGNIGTRSHSWDTIPPEGLPVCVVNTSFPNSYSTSSSSTLNFFCSSLHSEVSYPECKIGNGNWAACSAQSSHLVSGLTDAQNVQFCVRSHDSWLRYSSPSCLSWTVSLQSPNIQHLSVDVAHPYARLHFNANASSCPVTSFECKLEGPVTNHNWQTCENPKTYSQLALHQNYEFSVRARTLCNQVSSARSITWSSRADYNGPRCAFSSSPSSSIWHQTDVMADIACEGNPPNITFLCSDDGNNWSTCQNPTRITSNTTGVITKYVRGRDDLNVLGPVSSRSWRFDYDNPSVHIHELRWVQLNPEFVFESQDTGSGVARSECMIDGITTWAECASPKKFTNAVLSEAGRSFTFRLRAIDNVGRISTEAAHIWTNGNWSTWGACVRQPNNTGLQTRSCDNPVVAGNGYSCVGVSEQSCTPPPAPTCLNGANNPPTCSTCPAGRVMSGGQCVPLSWSTIYNVPSNSNYNQRVHCNFGTLCPNLSGWVNFIYHQTKFAHRCVNGGRGYWNSNGQYLCKPPIGYIDSGHRCTSPVALAAPGARGPGASKEKYEELRRAGAPLPVWRNPFSRNGAGLNYANNAATRKAVCEMNGYQSVFSFRGSSWSSPKDNAVLNWDPSTNRFSIQRGNTHNNWISDLVCVGKLEQSCRDEWQWIFRNY